MNNVDVSIPKLENKSDRRMTSYHTLRRSFMNVGFGNSIISKLKTMKPIGNKIVR
jgi:hypothetical protein